MIQIGSRGSSGLGSRRSAGSGSPRYRGSTAIPAPARAAPARARVSETGISSDTKDIYAEAKSAGFDVKALRALISERKKEPDAVAELAALLDTYRRALGDLAETPLGAAALRAVS